jgi:thiol-disulfide isomerase/thioredoxin
MSHFKMDLRFRAATSLAVSLLFAGIVHADPASAGRPAKEIQADIAAVDQDIEHNANFDVSIAYDPRFHAQMGHDIGSRRMKEADLYRELAKASPKLSAMALHLAAVDDARCAFWGDTDAQARVDARATDADPAIAADGKCEQQLIAWWNAIGNADAQTKIIDAVTELAQAHPDSTFIADCAQLMIQTNAASLQIGQRLNDLVCITLAKSTLGKSYAQQPMRMYEPLDFEGNTLKGKSFKLKDLRGKVVMVDFWATWCPPCRAEIPHVAELYQQYHDQGFEIIGVSSDNDRPQLTGFLKEHPEMPWQQLFSGGHGWHPLTKKFGINSIPRMLIVDKNGNLRAMNQSAERFKDLIPQLLAETYTPPPAKAVVKPTIRPIGT